MKINFHVWTFTEQVYRNKKKFVGFQGLLKLFCRGVFEHLISCLPTFQSVLKKCLIKDFDLS